MEYSLKCGAISAVATTQGGELISLKDGSGKEYLWQGDPTYWSGHNPNLFPIIGGLKDGTIYVDGTPFRMNRHGFARNSEFSVVEKGENFIVFQLQESETSLQAHPFQFTLNIRHQLTEAGFYTQYEVINPDTKPLPFCIGAHTAFNCPLCEGESFSDYLIVFDRKEDSHAIYPDENGCLSHDNKLYALPQTDTLSLDHQTFADIDTLVFEGLNSTGRYVHRCHLR